MVKTRKAGPFLTLPFFLYPPGILRNPSSKPAKSLKMIFEQYYAHIPNLTHQDGSLFLKEYEKRDSDLHQAGYKLFK